MCRVNSPSRFYRQSGAFRRAAFFLGMTRTKQGFPQEIHHLSLVLLTHFSDE